jgi:predicted RND superfamily exporter protein
MKGALLAEALRRAHERLVWTLVRHPRGVILILTLLTLGAVLCLFRLRIDPDINSLVRQNDPTLRLTRHLLGDQPLSRTLVVVLRAERPDQIEAALPGLVRTLRASPYLKRVIATREEFAGPRVEWIKQAPLFALSPETLDRLEARLRGPERRAEILAAKERLAEDPLSGKQTVLADPLGLRWILSEGAEAATRRFAAPLRSQTPYLVFREPAVAFLRGVGNEDSFNLTFTESLMSDLKGRLGESLGTGPVLAELAGGYVTATSQAAIMRRDIKLQFISSGIALLLYLGWFTRSWLSPHLVMIPVVVAIVWALGYGSAVLGPLTPLAMSMAAIVAGLGNDYPIHLLTRFRIERRGRGREDAIVRGQVGLSRAFVGAASTTMGGFLVLVLSQFPGLRQFGLLVFLGFTLSVVAALVLFPVLLLWVDRWVPPPAVERRPWVISWALAVGRHPMRRPVAGAILLAGIASWIAVGLGQIPLDLDLRNTLASGDPGQAVLERLEKDLGMAMGPVFALVDRSVPLDELRRKVEALRARGTIAWGDGPQALVPAPAARERVLRFERESSGWTEGALADLGSLGFKTEPFRKGLAQWQERLGAPAPRVEDLDRPEFAPLRSAMIYDEGPDSRWVAYLFPPRSLWRPKDRESFNAAVRAELGADVPLLSVYHVPDYQAGGVERDLKWVGGLAVAAILVLTVLCVGRWSDGILALVPVLVATGLTLAACTWLGGTIKSMNTAAIPILLGIGVDGGIHYVVALRARGWKDPLEAIEAMGTGYWGATWTTVLGFGSIATSATPGLSFLGVLVIVGMVACTASTLFMLPALVRPEKSRV